MDLPKTVPELRKLCRSLGIPECKGSQYVKKEELIVLLNRHYSNPSKSSTVTPIVTSVVPKVSTPIVTSVVPKATLFDPNRINSLDYPYEILDPIFKALDYPLYLRNIDTYSAIGYNGRTANFHVLLKNRSNYFLYNLSEYSWIKFGINFIPGNSENYSQLTSISLKTDLSNRDQVSSYLENLTKYPTLKSLKLTFEQRVASILGSLSAGLNENTTLTHLSLTLGAIEFGARGNSIQFINSNLFELIKSLQENTNLKSLELSGFLFTDGIYTILSENNTLTSLNLSQNEITTQKFNIFTLALRNNTTLKSLNLSMNEITDSGKVRDLIRNNSTLTSLNLYGNRLLDINSIVGALNTNTTLTALNLGFNIRGVSSDYRFLPEEPLLLALRNNTTLKDLNLSDNSIDNRSLQIMIENSLKYNTALTSLNLSINPITFSRLKNYLKTNTSLRFLDLSYTLIDPIKDFNTIKETLTSNKTLNRIHLHNYTWSQDTLEHLSQLDPRIVTDIHQIRNYLGFVDEKNH